MNYDFEWDPDKAKENKRKHGVSFAEATAVFRDPRALSAFDQDHSEDEDRWLTLGIGATGAMLVVHHTFREVDDSTTLIRIISSRKAAGREIEQYGG